MARPLRDSEYLYGIHDPGGETIMLEMGIPGWVVVTEAIGFNPHDYSGKNYRYLSDRGLGVIVRLNAGYRGVGTIPQRHLYDDFAQRCANFVEASKGAHIWILGNEMNHPIEWPGADWNWSVNPPRPVVPDKQGEKITPARYARCYRKVRRAIHAIPGHESDQVLVGAVAPWNALTKYAGNETGDWIKYFQDMLEAIGADRCDGITLHTYTHGWEASMIDSDAKLRPPYEGRHFHFRTYQDFMHAVPEDMRHLPVYITETDQDGPWRNENTGWVRRAYGEIDYWNRNNKQQIRALILYRWPKLDQWYIDGKQGIIEDFRQALASRYTWRTTAPQPVEEFLKPYQAKLQTNQVLKSGQAGDDVNLEVTVRNIGTNAWSKDTDNPVHIGYHWFDDDGNQLYAADYRTALPVDVAPGEEVTVRTKIGLPFQVGTHNLSLDMVHEGITWFADQGSEEMVIRVAVAPVGSVAGLGMTYPAIEDISGYFYRDANLITTRSEQDIRYLVINHTAISPGVPVAQMALAHRRRWPAFVCHYLVEADGAIYQTSPIEEVIDADEVWIAGGVNICVAGDFSNAIPPEDQLQALAELCAWLLDAFHLSSDAVVGIREFMQTESPGEQWLEGERWKEQLLTRIDRLRSVNGIAGFSGDELSPMESQARQLQEERDTLAARLAAFEAESRRWQTTVGELHTTIGYLQRATAAAPQPGLAAAPQPDFAAAALAAGVPKPAMVELVDQLPKHPTKRYDRRSLDRITHITVHHSAVPADVSPQRIARYHVENESHQWPGIGYHYYIEPDGTIDHTQDLGLISYHVYRNNAYTIGVCVAGNFTNRIPTDAQLDATARLIAWLMQEFSIPLNHVKGHKEYPHNATACPGQQWMSGRKWRQLLIERIATAQAGPMPPAVKPIQHYVLFWQHPNAWAREDWEGAINYIGRFRPTVGFSVDDAMAARRVTIIGGTAGVSRQIEDMLRAAGCRVERVAGESFAETKALLDTLAESGRRFLNP